MHSNCLHDTTAEIECVAHYQKELTDATLYPLLSFMAGVLGLLGSSPEVSFSLLFDIACHSESIEA